MWYKSLLMHDWLINDSNTFICRETDKYLDNWRRKIGSEQFYSEPSAGNNFIVNQVLEKHLGDAPDPYHRNPLFKYANISINNFPFHCPWATITPSLSFAKVCLDWSSGTVLAGKVVLTRPIQFPESDHLKRSSDVHTFQSWYHQLAQE